MSETRPLREALEGRFEGVTIEDTDPAVARVPAQRLPELCATLLDDPELAFSFLYSISGVDTGEALSTVYHVYSPSRDELAVLKVEVDRACPSVPTVSNVWAAADWHERECFDMFGITFEGHPDLRHLLVVDAAKGYLLRKDVPLRTIEEARARAD